VSASASVFASISVSESRLSVSVAAVFCSVLQCVAVCCSVLQCVAVCCSVLQCVAVCCSVCGCVESCHTRERVLSHV